MNDIVDFLTASTIGLLGWFFGGLDGFVKVLIAFTVIDYITGVCAAVIQKERLSSAVGFKGIAKKVVIFSLVGIAHVIDRHILGDTAALRTAVCLFYVGNEGISILENADRMKVPIPRYLKEKLLHFTEHDEEQKAA